MKTREQIQVMRELVKKIFLTVNDSLEAEYNVTLVRDTLESYLEMHGDPDHYQDSLALNGNTRLFWVAAYKVAQLWVGSFADNEMKKAVCELVKTMTGTEPLIQVEIQNVDEPSTSTVQYYAPNRELVSQLLDEYRRASATEDRALSDDRYGMKTIMATQFQKDKAFVRWNVANLIVNEGHQIEAQLYTRDELETMSLKELDALAMDDWRFFGAAFNPDDHMLIQLNTRANYIIHILHRQSLFADFPTT